LSAPPDPLAAIRGPTSKGKGEGRGREGEGEEGKGRGEEGKGRRGKGFAPPQADRLDPPLCVETNTGCRYVLSPLAARGQHHRG